jgi:Glycosyltransferase (GlcNAc)
VPYDPHIYFTREEISLELRRWTTGWDLFVPNEPVVYHHYANAGQRNRSAARSFNGPRASHAGYEAFPRKTSVARP